MKTINFNQKTKSLLLSIRSMFSAVLYALFLFIYVVSGESNSTEYLYLEVYNVTLLYIIINMLLFANDILSPKTKYVFSKNFVEVLLITLLSTILIISLFTLKTSINAYPLSSILIKSNAIIVIMVSFFIHRNIVMNLGIQ
ncbi:hypothetical protein [Aquimarina celericrescens]|uniref:Uncharacterized protein n=1 Tax=Aquimarina celericrescens TaxID=1964542 RepID=A0ABW5AZJ7_9FLAO|nr:hypothetical protein [Aquimarina celericrescens]